MRRLRQASRRLAGHGEATDGLWLKAFLQRGEWQPEVSVSRVFGLWRSSSADMAGRWIGAGHRKWTRQRRYQPLRLSFPALRRAASPAMVFRAEAVSWPDALQFFAVDRAAGT